MARRLRFRASGSDAPRLPRLSLSGERASHRHRVGVGLAEGFEELGDAVLGGRVGAEEVGRVLPVEGGERVHDEVARVRRLDVHRHPVGVGLELLQGAGQRRG